MAGRIKQLFNDYIHIFSIIIAGIGLIVLIIGVISILTDMMTEIIGEWNFYVLAAGIILFLTGVYYFYSFLSKKRFVLSELETNKRSEFIKRHKEVKNAVKHLPRKYAQLLEEKERELKIK